MWYHPLIADDQEYVKERVKHRRTRVDPGPDQLDLSCEAIHARHPTFAKRHPNSEQRDKFPIAFGRAVFRVRKCFSWVIPKYKGQGQI